MIAHVDPDRVKAYSCSVPRLARLKCQLRSRRLRISKRGNRYLRRLLINGASANLLRSKATNADPWVIGLRRRRPSLVVAVALANKTARIAWAVMCRQGSYRHRSAAA
jgi:transposase